LFSDQCWAYPVKDTDGNIWCIVRDLRNGNLVSRVGPLNSKGTKPTEFTCHLSMFHVIFQEKSARFESQSVPAAAPLRIFPINDVAYNIQRRYRFSPADPPRSSQCLYELRPPFHPDAPGFWAFAGEDASERYLFFQGSPLRTDDSMRRDDWKKWVVWDSMRREWSVLQCQRDWDVDGFYCLFSEVDGDNERVGLDWVTLE
jgi:hypothetical protein